MRSFTQKVHDVVRKIPKGEVRTYKEVAEAAGSPKAARAVANVMAANRSAETPCHRVVRSDGTLGGYSMGGISTKRKILLREGVKI